MTETIKTAINNEKSTPIALIRPSSSYRPKAVTKIDMAGRVLVPGMGNIIDMAIRAMVSPITVHPARF